MLYENVPSHSSGFASNNLSGSLRAGGRRRHNVRNAAAPAPNSVSPMNSQSLTPNFQRTNAAAAVVNVPIAAKTRTALALPFTPRSAAAIPIANNPRYQGHTYRIDSCEDSASGRKPSAKP